MKKLSAQQYAQLLVQAAGNVPASECPKIVHQFVAMLVERRAWKLVPRILDHVQQLEDQQNEVTRVQVWGAHPPSSALTATLKKLLGKVELESSTDPNLLGGFKVRVGDTQIDATLANQLTRLEIHLTS